jgi:regulator of nucleoside diphosphate kinase
MPQHNVVLTAGDHALLERRLARNDGITAALPIRQKLAAAIVVPPPEIAPDIVTLHSRVHFRIDGGPLEERTLVSRHSEEVIGLTLLVWTVRGLALLGLRVGQSVPVRRLDGSYEVISVEAVPYQPEAAGRARRATAATAGPPPAGVTLLGAYRQRRGGYFPRSGGDDPGPSAA